MSALDAFLADLDDDDDEDEDLEGIGEEENEGGIGAVFAAGGLGTKAVDFQALAMQQFEQMEKAAAQAVGGGQATAAGGTSDTTDPAGNDPNVAMARALAPAVAAAAAGPGGEAAADGGAAKAKKKKKLSKQEEDALRALRVDDIHEAVRTHGSKRYNRVMTEVRRHAAEGLKIELSEGMLEHDPAYQLVVDANALMADLDDDVTAAHVFVRNHYAKRFPELETLVYSPVDYARVVKRIQNNMRVTSKDLNDLLPSSVVMVVTLATASSPGEDLNAEELSRVVDGCDLLLAIVDDRKQIMDFVAQSMDVVAPNMAALVGSTCAAQLMSAAGGLESLSKIPSCNIQLLGNTRKALGGMAAGKLRRVGFIQNADLVVKAPPQYKMKTIRQVAGKVTLSARVDSFHEKADGSLGRSYHDLIEKKLDKWMEPPPIRQQKALPKPEKKKTTRRGGRQHRAKKARLAQTELAKQMNRVKFGVEEDDGTGAGSTSIRAKRKEVSFKEIIEKKNKKGGKKGANQGNARSGLQSGLRSQIRPGGIASVAGGLLTGVTSSVAFSHTQGLSLENPNAAEDEADRVRESNFKYFSSAGSFIKVKKAKAASAVSDAGSADDGGFKAPSMPAPRKAKAATAVAPDNDDDDDGKTKAKKNKSKKKKKRRRGSVDSEDGAADKQEGDERSAKRTKREGD